MVGSELSQAQNQAREIEKGPSFEVWQGPSGAMRNDWVRGGIMRGILRGHGHAEFAAPLVRRWDALLKSDGKVTIFGDFWEMTTYDSGFRVETSGWLVKHRNDLAAVHVVTQSKLVSMGIAVVNLALGGIYTVHTSYADFERAARRYGLPGTPSMPR